MNGYPQQADFTPAFAEVGTSSYLPTLLSHIHSTHPNLPLDPVVLQSLLLCLIARIQTVSCLSSLLISDVCGQSVGANVGDVADTHRNTSCAHLILRTKEEDIGMLVHLVSLTLTTVFGIPTHKHKVHSKSSSKSPRPRTTKRCTRPDSTSSPDAFLRALFFRRPCFNPVRLSADLTPRMGYKPLRSPPHVRRCSSSQTPRPSPLRAARSIEPERTDDGASTDHYVDGMSLASSRRPLLGSSGSGTTPTSTLRSRRGPPEKQGTDPLPLSLAVFMPPDEGLALTPLSGVSLESTGRKHMSNPEVGAAAESEEEAVRPSLVLPRAVVVSGLEHATIPSQRMLLQVLAERQLVLDEESLDPHGFRHEAGTWNLPEDFIMVYVCKIDTHERPSILRGLLDKFSMSVDIIISPATHQAYSAYRGTPSTTPHTSPFPSSHPLPSLSEPGSLPISPLRSPSARPSALPSQSHTPQTPAIPSLPPAELAQLRSLANLIPSYDARAYTAMHPSLRTYLRDLFSAARHHPVLDGTLLTHRAQADAEALVRAYRVLFGDSLGGELVQAAAMLRREVGSQGGGTSTNITGDTESGSTASWDKEVDGMDWAGQDGVHREGEYSTIAESEPGDDYSVRVTLPFDAIGDVSSIVMDPQVKIWDISEVDVARIFPRVVSHRLRVRDGPDHEVMSSVMFPAVTQMSPEVGHDRDTEAGWERRTVKEVLVEILADV